MFSFQPVSVVTMSSKLRLGSLGRAGNQAASVPYLCIDYTIQTTTQYCYSRKLYLTPSPFMSNRRSPDFTPATLAGLWKSTERMNTGQFPRRVIPNPPSTPRGILNFRTLEMTTRLGGTFVERLARSTTYTDGAGHTGRHVCLCCACLLPLVTVPYPI